MIKWSYIFYSFFHWDFGFDNEFFGGSCLFCILLNLFLIFLLLLFFFLLFFFLISLLFFLNFIFLTPFLFILLNNRAFFWFLRTNFFHLLPLLVFIIYNSIIIFLWQLFPLCLLNRNYSNLIICNRTSTELILSVDPEFCAHLLNISSVILIQYLIPPFKVEEVLLIWIDIFSTKFQITFSFPNFQNNKIFLNLHSLLHQHHNLLRFLLLLFLIDLYYFAVIPNTEFYYSFCWFLRLVVEFCYVIYVFFVLSSVLFVLVEIVCGLLLLDSVEKLLVFLLNDSLVAGLFDSKDLLVFVESWDWLILSQNFLAKNIICSLYLEILIWCVEDLLWVVCLQEWRGVIYHLSDLVYVGLMEVVLVFQVLLEADFVLRLDFLIHSMLQIYLMN